MSNCRTNLVGIQLVYCDSNNQQQSVWINLKKVQALAWCDEEVKAKGKGAGGNQKLPTDPNGPGKCKPAGLVDSDLCWWDGKEWICGVE